MWFSTAKQALYGGFSRIVERNTELERELAAEREKVKGLEGKLDAIDRQYVAQIAGLERQLAVSQGTQDWMMATVNELKQERGVLFERILQLTVPVPVIGYERPPEAPVAAPQPANPPNVPPDLDPALLRTLVAQGPKVQIPMRGPIAVNGAAPPSPPPALADLGAISFEDMGDEAARREGIAHNSQGEAVYTR